MQRTKRINQEYNSGDSDGNNNDGNDNNDNNNIINYNYESPPESIITPLRMTSSVYNPVELLEYLASQEQSSINYNNDNHNNESPSLRIYNNLNEQPPSSPLPLSPLEEVQNQIVELRNRRSRSIVNYQNSNVN